MVLPVGGGSPGTMTAQLEWWVLRIPPTGAVSRDGGVDTYVSVQASSRAAAQRNAADKGGSVAAGPFDSQKKANGYISGHNLATSPFKGTSGSFPNINPVAWLTENTGGILAGAIEAGFVQIVKDIWAVIVGPLLVIAGLIIAFVVLLIFFKDDIAELGSLAAMVVK